MNKNLNLVEILKDAPKGAKLWSPLCGECELVAVDENYTYPILCKASDGKEINFTKLGKYYDVFFKNGECVLFPSKEYCAHANMTMAIKYGLPTSIAIMMNLPANIILLVDM